VSDAPAPTLPTDYSTRSEWHPWNVAGEGDRPVHCLCRGATCGALARRRERQPTRAGHVPPLQTQHPGFILSGGHWPEWSPQVSSRPGEHRERVEGSMCIAGTRSAVRSRKWRVPAISAA
jgi:hypothetical protein